MRELEDSKVPAIFGQRSAILPNGKVSLSSALWYDIFFQLPDAQVVVQFRPFDAISSASFQLRLRPGQNENCCHPLFSKRFLPMALLLIGHDNADWYVWKAWVWKVVTAVTPAGVRFILNR